METSGWKAWSRPEDVAHRGNYRDLDISHHQRPSEYTLHRRHTSIVYPARDNQLEVTQVRRDIQREAV